MMIEGIEMEIQSEIIFDGGINTPKTMFNLIAKLMLQGWIIIIIIIMLQR